MSEEEDPVEEANRFQSETRRDAKKLHSKGQYQSWCKRSNPGSQFQPKILQSIRSSRTARRNKPITLPPA